VLLNMMVQLVSQNLIAIERYILCKTMKNK
jgi:hypothetical protein